MMKALNLPSYDVQLREQSDGKYIYDIIRKKYIKLSSEEWVRQHFIHFLIEHRQYPVGLFRIERGVVKASRQGRTDIEVWSTEGKPLLLVECKSYEQGLNKQAVLQASVYNDALQARFMVLTNGLSHYAFEYIAHEEGKRYDRLVDIPFYKDMAL
jgi:type I site-specific restriction endonuclease